MVTFVWLPEYDLIFDGQVPSLSTTKQIISPVHGL